MVGRLFSETCIMLPLRPAAGVYKRQVGYDFSRSAKRISRGYDTTSGPETVVELNP